MSPYSLSVLNQFGVFYVPVQIFFDSGLENASFVDMLIYQCRQECHRDCVFSGTVGSRYDVNDVLACHRQSYF